MMTKKDYIRAADHVRFMRVGMRQEKEAAPYVEDAFVDFFKRDNPRFDETRFRTACEPKK